MNFLLAALAAAAYIAHHMYEPLAAFSDNPSRAAEDIFYIARGVEGVVLFGAILYVASTRKAKEWQLMALAVICVYGAAQEALTSICGAAYMMSRGANLPIENGSVNLCEVANGWPTVSTIALVTAAALISIHARKNES